MSNWGARTGYAYEAQRVAFLREVYRNEKRATLGLSPRDSMLAASMHTSSPGLSPRDQPGMAALTASMHTSPALDSPGRHVYNSPSPFEGRRPPPAAATSSLQRTWPAVSTHSQVAFRPHDAEFLARFRAETEHGKANDKTTQYREQVFQLWNISGIKSPAVFR